MKKPEEEVVEETTEVEMPVSQMFEIKLTNLTTGEPGSGGQVFSHPIFVTHAAGINLAEVGQPASPALVLLAENGDPSGLVALATAAGANSLVAADMVPPGGSITVTVTADAVNSSLSVGSMLVSTNDAIIAATDVPLFDEAGMPVSMSIDLNSYDAGSEDNTEMASDIPGPLGLDAEADPAGSNARVPTEGGVIMPHAGIQGGADVGEAFAWTEPTAMLMITPVDAPAEPVVEEPVVEEPVVEEPVVEEPTVTEGPGFDVTLTPGLNMVSIPLMPEEPYTAKSLAEMLGATVVIQLDAATQSFVGYTVAEEGDGFGIDGGMGYIVNTPAGGMVKFTGSAWDNQPEPEEAPVVEEPVVEEPVVEAPVVEEPVVEEPVVEAPVVEEPALRNPLLRHRQPKKLLLKLLPKNPQLKKHLLKNRSLKKLPLHQHFQPLRVHGRLWLPAISKACIRVRLTPSLQKTSALALSPRRMSRVLRDVHPLSGQISIARASLKQAINLKSRSTTNAGISSRVPSSAPFQLLTFVTHS